MSPKAAASSGGISDGSVSMVAVCIIRMGGVNDSIQLFNAHFDHSNNKLQTLEMHTKSSNANKLLLY